MQKHQSITNGKKTVNRAQPVMGHGQVVQEFNQVIRMPIALEEKACAESVRLLNQILADTMSLRDLYKKHHWQVAGHTFYQLHLLFDKHYEEQNKLVDEIAERIQLLGGISVAMAPDVAEMTKVERPPRGREDVPTQITRLLQAHELIIGEVRKAIKKTEDNEDMGSNDMLMGSVLRTHELQVWFVAEHLVNLPTEAQ